MPSRSSLPLTTSSRPRSARVIATLRAVGRPARYTSFTAAGDKNATSIWSG